MKNYRFIYNLTTLKIQPALLQVTLTSFGGKTGPKFTKKPTLSYNLLIHYGQ